MGTFGVHKVNETCSVDLGDMLPIGTTPQETRQFTQMAMSLLEFLGFHITMIFTLPSEKTPIRRGSTVLFRTLAQLFGTSGLERTTLISSHTSSPK